MQDLFVPSEEGSLLIADLLRWEQEQFRRLITNAAPIHLGRGDAMGSACRTPMERGQDIGSPFGCASSCELDGQTFMQLVDRIYVRACRSLASSE